MSVYAFISKLLCIGSQKMRKVDAREDEDEESEPNVLFWLFTEGCGDEARNGGIVT